MSEIFVQISSGQKRKIQFLTKYPGGDWFQQWLPSPPAIRKWQTKDRLPGEGVWIWHPRISTDLWWTEDVSSGYKPWEEWVWTEQGNQPWRRSAQVAMQYDFESHQQMTCHKIVSHHHMTCHSQPDMSPLHLSHYDACNATDWRGAKMFQTGRSPLLSSTVFFIQSVSSNLARWFTCLVCLYDDLRGIVLRCQLHVDVQPGNSWSTTFQRWVGEQSLIFQVKAQNTKMCQKCINLTSSSNQSLNNNR